MAEAKKGRKAGEGARFLKVVVEVLKCESARLSSSLVSSLQLNTLQSMLRFGYR